MHKICVAASNELPICEQGHVHKALERRPYLHRKVATCTKSELAVVYSEMGDKEFSDALFSRDLFGQTPLHIAALRNKPKLLRRLVDKCPPERLEEFLSAQDKQGHTIPVACCHFGAFSALTAFLEIAPDFLKKHKSDISVVHLLVFHAYSEDFKAALEALLSAGAPVDEVNSNNETPLHKAASKGEVETAELLLKVGANINAQSK